MIEEAKENSKARRGGKFPAAVRMIIAAAALAAFGAWLFLVPGHTLPGVIAAALSLCIFTFALILFVNKAAEFFSGSEELSSRPLGVRSGRQGRAAQTVRVMFAVLLARLAVVVTAYVFSRVFRNGHGSIFATLESIWLKLDTDAPHYISIAENGYLTSSPEMYNLVFLPLFPLCIRALNILTGSSFTSAFIINTVCSCAAAAVIYRLAYADMGRRPAKLAVLFTFAMPAAIFFIAPMSEALFLLLSASVLLALRKRKFWLAAVLGALASFTRSVGIIMIVPFAAEAIAYAARRRREAEGKAFGATVAKLIVCGLIFCLGTFGYLLINRLLWGDWFKFLEFQRDIWYQHLVPFFGTVSMQTEQLIASVGSANETALGLWLPNLLYIFGALLVLLLTARTMRPSYTLYSAAYIAVTCGASWLLSAPRYLTALVCIPLALAHLCEGDTSGVATGRARAKALAVSFLLIVGQALYLLMYVFEFEIY